VLSIPDVSRRRTPFVDCGGGGGDGGGGAPPAPPQRHGGVWPDNETLGLPTGLNLKPMSLLIPQSLRLAPPPVQNQSLL
jgi:hypothetical protein